MRTVQHGFALMTVVLVLLVAASVAYLLVNEGSMGQRLFSNDAERLELEYVTEAGRVHASWQLAQNTSCSAYTGVPVTTFGDHSYDASFTPNNGSPVVVAVKSRLANGITHKTRFTNVQAFRPPQARQFQISADPGRDAMLDDFYSSRNYGASDYVQVNTASWIQRPVIQFDLAAIPTGVRIISATLELKNWSVNAPGVVGVHRLTRGWVEGSKFGGGQADGATWYTYDGTNNWSSAGGDFQPGPYAEVAVSAATAGQWVGWEIASLVQAWVNSDVPNHGVLLKGDASVDKAMFASRETADPLNAPKLTVVFACECGSVCGAGGGESLILSTDTAAVLGGLSFADNDLAEYDPGTDAATLFFDGGLTTLNVEIRATHVLANGHLVLAAKGDPNATLGGVTFQAGDLVDYDPVADDATLIFDGNTRFTDPLEKISAVHVLDNGHFVLATDSPAILGGLSFTDRDLVEYDPWSDTATLFFDGGPTTLDVDITAVQVLGDDHLVIAAKGDPNVNLGGVTFQAGDLVEYDPVTDTATLIFDGGALFVNPAEKLSSVHVGAGSGTVAAGANPLAHWKLDDGAGPTAIDSAGGHDGTLVNDPVWVAGKLDGGLDFDGDNDRVDVGTFDVTGSGLTMMAWFNAETISTADGRIVSKANGTSASDAWWQLSTTDSGSNRFLRMRVKAGGTTTTFADSSENLTPGGWYFAVATYDSASGDMKLYLDGGEVANGSHAAGGAVDVNPAVPVALGANGTAERFFDGVLDDVRLYDRALSATEVSALFAEGGGGATGGNYLDQFNNEGSYAGNDGTLTWATNWLEINESNGPSSGDEVVTEDVSEFQLRVRDNDGGGEGVKREADLSACAGSTLSFDYRRESFDNSDDYVTVDVSANGGSSWAEFDRLSGPADESSYQSTSYDISSSMASNTRIRFLTSSSLGGSDELYIDNVEITCD